MWKLEGQTKKFLVLPKISAVRHIQVTEKEIVLVTESGDRAAVWKLDTLEDALTIFNDL
jgi:hypothetical protein